MTALRTVLFTAVTAAALAVALLAPWSPAPLRMAEQIAGTTGYTIHYLHQPVGRFTATVAVTPDRVTFTSRLETELPGMQTTFIDERLEFAARPPFELRMALRDEHNAQHRLRTEIGAHAGGGYKAVVRRNGRAARHRIDRRYRLRDHLALELALDRGQAAGATLSLPQLDLERVAMATRKWHVVATDAGGYRVRDATRGEDTLLELDDRLVVHRMSMAGLLSFVRDDEASLGDTADQGMPQHHDAAGHTRATSPGLIAPGRALVALDTPVNDPTRVASASIAVPASVAAALGDDASFDRHADPTHDLLLLAAATPRRARRGDAQAIHATVGIPSDHPQIRALAAQALGDRDTGSLPATPPASTTAPSTDETAMLERTRRLVDFVHGHLRYRIGNVPLSVLDVVDAREGDCDAFAGLFTALARAAGLPARTVTGLVYAETEGPGLYLHAWNEVLIGDRWHAVDPTLGVTELSALYIPFPATHGGYLRAYAAFAGADVAVRAVGYF